MKTITDIRQYIRFFCMLGLAITFVACNDDDEYGDLPRAFSPVATDLEAISNSIYAKWNHSKDAVNYTVELSRDTFKTIIESLEIEDNTHTFTNLDWEQSYQVRVRVNTADPDQASKFAWLNDKDIKIGTFVGIIDNPSSDATDLAVKVVWTVTGNDVTHIEVRTESWNGEVVKTVDLTTEESKSGSLIISGLEAGTRYAVLLYSGETLRGYTYLTTKAAIEAEYIYDFRIEDDFEKLDTDFFAALNPGTVVLLEGGKSYPFSGDLTSDIQIMTAYSFDGRATLISTGGLNLAENAAIDQIVISDVNITGDESGYSSRYLFNANKVSSVNVFTVNNCEIKNLRGIFRTQSGPRLEQVIIHNCIIDSINGYGVMNCDNENSAIANMVMTNTTLSHVQRVFVDTKSRNIRSAIIENCTFYHVPYDTRHIIDFNGRTASARVDNNLFGPNWDDPTVPEANKGFRSYRGELSFSSGSNFLTSDVVLYTPVSGEEPTLPGMEKLNTGSASLWADPENGDFTITGNSSAGDPRWR